MRTRTVTLLFTAVVTAVALTGCGVSGDVPPPGEPIDPLPRETPAPDPEHTETEEPSTPADPADWTIDLHGVGPLVIGEDFDTTFEKLDDQWEDQTQCKNLAHWHADDQSLSMYFAAASADDNTPIEVISVSVMADAVALTGPVTAEGLGVGATKDEVHSAYPDAEDGEASIGDGSTWVKVPMERATSLFFQYTPDADEAFAVILTSLDEPPYEPCA